MNTCSVSKKPHLICKCLILSKISCFDVKASWWGCFKGISSLSYLFLAGNVDNLLYDITGLVCIFLVPESDESSDHVYNNSYEDEDSDEIIIVICAIQTSSSSLIASIRTCSSPLMISLWHNVFSNYSLALFIISITLTKISIHNFLMWCKW